MRNVLFLLLTVATICQINEINPLHLNGQYLADLKELRSRVKILRGKVQHHVERIQDVGKKFSHFQHDIDKTIDSTLLERIEVLGRKFETINGIKEKQENISRAVRISSQSSPGTGGVNNVIAFYSYISQIQSNLAANQTLVFDTALTNEGKSYDHQTGIFLAPENGVYVFMWKIRMLSAEHSTELVINGVVYGATFLRAKSGDDGSVTGTVVARLSAEDVVFVRTHSLYAGDGIIHSNEHGRPFIAGWKLK